MSESMTQAEFAARHGWHRSRVTQLKNAKPPRIVLNDDGSVNVEESEALIAAYADSTRVGVALHHQRARVLAASRNNQLNVDSVSVAESSVAAKPLADDDYGSFNRARALKEEENAKLAKIKREELESLLIRRDAVQKQVEALASIVVKGLTSIPSRVMPLINAEADAGNREAILESQIRLVLSDFADQAEKLSSQ
jgi:hypothetical protein